MFNSFIVLVSGWRGEEIQREKSRIQNDFNKRFLSAGSPRDTRPVPTAIDICIVKVFPQYLSIVLPIF